MEDEKKKKRNKKKKNKQTTKTTTTTTEDDGVDQNHNVHVSNDEANDHNQVSTTTTTTEEIRNGQVDLSRHQSNGTQAAILADAEKQSWLKREAVFEETIKHLQEEKGHYIQREATLEETIKLLRNESDLHSERLATLDETIKQLQNESNLHSQKETTLEETIKQLRNENDLHKQKEAGLELDILKLQSEKNLWLQQEARLEADISKLLDDCVDFSSNGESLEKKMKLLESDKDCWIQKESISKETIARLNDDITRLQMQVTELEESRNNLLQENQQLAKHASSLQLQLQNLERNISSAHSSNDHMKVQEDLNAQIESASALVGKLITENAELVEKVNELFFKLHQQNVADRLSSTAGSDPMVRTANSSEALSESSEIEIASTVSHKLESPEIVEVKEERIGVINGHAVPAASTDSIGEIVQIPLDDNELQDVESQIVEHKDKDSVPLTDAPLIGAPFRFVSFVAKYVSGADLVNYNS